MIVEFQIHLMMLHSKNRIAFFICLIFIGIYAEH